jgi:hypothetical protein
MAKPNLVVVKLPGLSGGRGPAGADGISAVNNIVNPVLDADFQFNQKTEIQPFSYEMGPSITLTFEATLILRGLDGSSAVVHVEGPPDSLVNGVMTYPYSAAPQVSGNAVSFGIPTDSEHDYYVVKLAGSIRNGNSSGRVSIYAENLDEAPGGFVAQASFVQWSIPVFAVIGSPTGGGGSNGDGITKEQADSLYVSRTDSRLSDARVPTDKSVNANKIAAGGLPISSIDQLRSELDIRVKTINGTSPDASGNINISGTGGVSGLSETQADAKYVRLNDARLSDQRVPLDNSVINNKVPNSALDQSKINGLSTALDTIIAQLSNLTSRVQTIEQNGATPGGGTPGAGYPSVYTATY